MQRKEAVTPEEINMAIAECLGRHYHKPTPGEIKSGSYHQYEPNYYGDLNSMHDAEKMLMPFESEAWQTYSYWLAHLTPLGGQDHATAPQRAEAFLRVKGLWKE